MLQCFKIAWESCCSAPSPSKYNMLRKLVLIWRRKKKTGTILQISLSPEETHWSVSERKKSVLCLMWSNERIFMTSFDLYPWIKTILDSIFSKTPWMGVNALRQARSQNQNLAETKTNKSSFCRKMRHEVTLKSEILSQLDFKSAAQDVVFNCLDGQVCLWCVWIWDLLLMY